MAAMTDAYLSECIATGQWRCTVEELQETAARLLTEKQMWERQAETSRLVADNAYHKMRELLDLADRMALTRKAAFPLVDDLESARERWRCVKCEKVLLGTEAAIMHRVECG